MIASGPSPQVCVIGAGCSGLAAAKSFRDVGFRVDILEREADLGGNWNYDLSCARVYRSTHMISSKGFLFPDFPAPADFPAYPHHSQVLSYLRAYANGFRLHEMVQFRTSVERVDPCADGGWSVKLAGGETRRYAALVIANGHNWSPRWPEYPGRFEGRILHSAEYKSPDILANKRVLVVGGGNSGCDIAVEAVQHGATTFHSMRRAYHYIPKFALGLPSDRLAEAFVMLRLPLWVRRMLTAALLRVLVGSPSNYGLPKPDHRLFESHPLVNSLLLYYVGHGDIRPKPNIARLHPDRVEFVDGTSEAVDVIVYATGYQPEFPFIDRQFLNWVEGRPRLYLNVFHPSYDDLFVIGMVQADSGVFGLVHWQSQAAARFLHASLRGLPSAEALRQEKSRPAPDATRQYTKSPRHLLELEHGGYQRTLRKLARRLGAD